MSIKYPSEECIAISFEKIKKHAEAFEAKVNNILYKINAINLSGLPFIEIKDALSSNQIPRKISCIYFLLHEVEGILYIGKTKDLFSRWYYAESCFPHNPPDKQHHMLERCLDIGNVKLHWVEMNSKLAITVESIFINKFKPKWNTVIH